MIPIVFSAPPPSADDTAQPVATLLDALQRAGLEPVPPPESSTPAARWVDHCRDLPPEQRPHLWITHGLSLSMPDVDDRRAAAALNLLWVISEPVMTTDSPATGEMRETLREAAAVITTDSATAAGVEPWLDAKRLIRLPPFLDPAPFLAAHRNRANHRATVASHLRLPADSLWLLTLVPMTPATLASYRLLARACSRWPLLNWHLIVVGAGPQRNDVHTLLRVLPPARLRIWDALAPLDRVALMVACDLYLWPACAATGLHTLLEAQAAGLGVVACQSSGVTDRVRDGVAGRLALPDNAESFANAISFLLRHPEFRVTCGKQAREQVAADHSIQGAARVLQDALAPLAGLRE
jgi:hypothetical protein